MPVLIWHATNTVVDSHQEMSETAPASGLSNPAAGWTVAKVAATAYSPFRSAQEQASGTFTASIHPLGIAINSGNCLRSTQTYNGSFAAGDWSLRFRAQADNSGGDQDGNIGVRIWRGSNGTGDSATQVTGARVEGTAVTNLAVGSGQISTATISLGAFALNNEYLFAELGWEITGAGGANTRDVIMSIGNSSTMLISPNFTQGVVAAGNATPLLLRQLGVLI